MRPAYQTFCVASMLLLASLQSLCQTDSSTEKKWVDILTQYQNGKLSDSVYMDEAQALVDLSIKDVTLKDKLTNYQKIAWSNPAYQKRRLRYYLMMYNNCVFTYRAGASFYYLEKAEEERKKMKPYRDILQTSIAVMFNYGRTKSGFTKCIEEYNRILPYLKEMPQKIITDSLPPPALMNATAVLTDIVEFYCQLKDTANALKACYLSENIRNSIRVQTYQYNKDLLLRPYYNCYLTQHYKQKILHQFDKAKKMLDSAYAIAISKHTGGDYIWWEAVQADMFLNYFKFFIEQKQTDSASYYLQHIKERQDSSYGNLGDGTAYLYNYGLLKAGEGDYKTAYENILNAYEKNDSVIGIKTADINNNMYAQVVAEEKGEALKKSEAIERKRNILIAAISAISLIVILFLYWQMRKKDKEARERIYKLNYASQLQIMELEEKSLLIKQEEQRKLGMDLHDDLAGSIAAVKMKLETELAGNQDMGQVERLTNINGLIGDIYNKTRNKSHDLYSGKDNEGEVSFSKRIRLITENSFAADKYKITIDVEDEFMKAVSLEIKIQLLYIIQETITNIIKHAQAQSISIFIYEDIGGLSLQVNDDGKGFNTSSKKKGIGLESIRNRAGAVGGNVKIVSGNKGTEIIITVPLEQQTVV